MLSHYFCVLGDWFAESTLWYDKSSGLHESRRFRIPKSKVSCEGVEYFSDVPTLETPLDETGEASVADSAMRRNHGAR